MRKVGLKIDQEAIIASNPDVIITTYGFYVEIQLDKSQVAKAGKISMLLKTSK